jgi:phosphatidate cytidylyltransferase
LDLNNFLTRTFVGAAYIALIVGSLLLGDLSFGLLCVIVLIFALDEYYKMVKKLKIKTPENWATGAGVFVFVLFMLYKNDIIPSQILFIIPLVFIGFMIDQMMSSQRSPLTNLAVTSFAFIYVVFPIISLYLIGFYDKFTWSQTFNHELLLGFFILVWASDTGAYLAGNAFGKHKLFERISPKKTIEGSIGGMLLTMILAYFMADFFSQISRLDWIVVAILVVVFGTFGDLFESLLKRNAEIKDSGKIIPGHGGMLDRFDSILFAAPAVFIYLTLIGS